MDRRALEAIGVTRVARITGLDRLGVEVACAIRPLGHVLQVSNGKGFTRERATLTALAEAAELAAAESIDPTRFLFASADEMAARFGARALITPDELPGPAACWHRGFRCAWIEGRDLFSGARVFVPATGVQCGPLGSALGPAVSEWTSNGMGAHRAREGAIRHALLEAIERHALAVALPHGWTRAVVRDRAMTPPTDASPLALALARADDAGIRFAFINVTLPALGVPVIGCVLLDEVENAILLTAGYAAATTLEAAMAGAFLEAAQSRLTDIHGAREDIELGGSADARRLRKWLDSLPGQFTRVNSLPAQFTQVNSLPAQFTQVNSPAPVHSSELRAMSRRSSDATIVRDLLSRLRRFGAQRVACVEWQLGSWRVAKVLIPGFHRSELL